MPPKAEKGKKSRGGSKKAKDRKEKKLLEERINNSKQKCEEARGFLEPTGKRAEPDYVKAKDALDAAVEFYDMHALPFYLLGECCRAQGELAAAIDHFSQALDVESRYVAALEARALCYQLQDDIPHAIEDYTSMIEQDPENDHAFNMRGVCLASTRVPGLSLKMTDFKRCESDLKAAARLNEANYHAMANLGKLYEDQGHLDEALTYYTASLKVKASYDYARFRRACAAMLLAEKTVVDNEEDDDEDGAEEDAAAAGGGGNSPAVKSAGKPSPPPHAAIAANITEIEREMREKMDQDARRVAAINILKDAEADFTHLLGFTDVSVRELADVNVVLNLGVCQLLLEDHTSAEATFALADQIIAARPALVEAGEASSIDNVEQIKKVLELRKGVLRRKKLERAAEAVASSGS